MKKKLFVFILVFSLVFSLFGIVSTGQDLTQKKYDYLKWLFHFLGYDGTVFGAAVTDTEWAVVESIMRDEGAIDENGNIITQSENGESGRYFGEDDSGNLIIKGPFFDVLFQQVEEKLKALNGYYLFDGWMSANNKSYEEIEAYLNSKTGFGYKYSNYWTENHFKETYEYVISDYSSIYPDLNIDFIYVTWQSIVKRLVFYVYPSKYGYYINYVGGSDQIQSDSVCYEYEFSGFEQLYSSRLYNGTNLFGTPDNVKVPIGDLCISFKPVKIFYSKTDYDMYKAKAEGGNVPRMYLAPQFSGGDVTINQNFFTAYDNGTFNDAAIQKKLDRIMKEIEQSRGYTYDDSDDIVRQDMLDEWFKRWLEYLATDPGAEPGIDPGGGDDPEPDMGGGGSGGSVDYTDILEQILAACSDTQIDVERILQLLEALVDFAGNAGCQYDFGELKTYLDTLMAENKDSLDALGEKLDGSNVYLSDVVSRLNEIYERMGGMADYTDILDRIYESISSGEYSLDDVVKAIDTFAEANGMDLGEVLAAIQTSNEYFELLLDRLPSEFAGFDDSGIIGKLDDIIDELEDNNDYNAAILNQLENIYGFLQEESASRKVRDKARECAEKASEVFPTCVPWDMARLVNALAASPETPVVRIPVQVASIGIDQEIVIDLHSFDDFAGKFRTIMVVLFAFFLMMFTLKYYKDKM